MDRLPLDILTLILSDLKPSVVEAVCRRWQTASRLRSYLGEYHVPPAVLVKYSRLRSFEGSTDVTFLKLAKVTFDLTVHVERFDLATFIQAYPTGSSVTLRFVGPDSVISFNGSTLTILLEGPPVIDPFIPISLDSRPAWLLAGINNQAGRLSKMTLEEANTHITSIFGKGGRSFDLTDLVKAASLWGKFNLNLICHQSYPLRLPSIKVGRLCLIRRPPVSTDGPEQLGCLIDNMRLVDFDSAELRVMTDLSGLTEALGVRLCQVFADSFGPN